MPERRKARPHSECSKPKTGSLAGASVWSTFPRQRSLHEADLLGVTRGPSLGSRRLRNRARVEVSSLSFVTSREDNYTLVEGAAVPGPFSPLAGESGAEQGSSSRREVRLSRLQDRETGDGSRFLPLPDAGTADLGGAVRSGSGLSPCPQRPGRLGAQQQGADTRRRSELEGHAGSPPPSLPQGPQPMAPCAVPSGPTCAPAACSPASACSSGPRWSGCHFPALSPSFPGSSPTVVGAGVGVEKTFKSTELRTWEPQD